jgi:lysine-N-methylase
VVVHFRGRPYLKRRDDGSCVFLKEDGLCRIHADHGFAEKPIACQVFPFNLAPGAKQIRVGVNFLCRSVQENKGADLPSHRNDLRRFAAELPELNVPADEAALARGIDPADEREARVLLSVLDEWLTRDEVSFSTRLDGLAWIAQSLGEARLAAVRDDRFEELVRLLGSALPGELDLLPIEAPTARQSALLRQAAFTRTEDPMIGDGGSRRGRIRTTLSQLKRSRIVRRGRGLTPMLSSVLPSGVRFQAIEGVGPFSESPDAAAIDELCLRWVRATLYGSRAWGSAHYGWSIVDGLQALVLNIACAGWIARLCSAAESRPVAGLEDVRTAIGRVDRHSGRAPWLGNPVELVRLRYLRLDDGLRRVLHSNW